MKHFSRLNLTFHHSIYFISFRALSMTLFTPYAGDFIFNCFQIEPPPANTYPSIHPPHRTQSPQEESKSACQPPHHKGRCRADRDGHPGRVKARGGTGVHWYLTAKGAKTAKDSTALALRPLRCSIS